MNAIAMALTVLLSPNPPDVKFEKFGVRVGGEFIDGAAFELRTLPSGVLLVSGKAVEPISAEILIEAASDRRLVGEPGVRVSKLESGYRLETHGPRSILVRSGDKRIEVSSPVSLTPTAEGWTLGEDRTLGKGEVRVGLRGQETKGEEQTKDKEQTKDEEKTKGEEQTEDEELEMMRRAAKKMQEERGQLAKAAKELLRRIFNLDPLATGERADDTTTIILEKVSPDGSN